MKLSPICFEESSAGPTDSFDCEWCLRWGMALPGDDVHRCSGDPERDAVPATEEKSLILIMMHNTGLNHDLGYLFIELR